MTYTNKKLSVIIAAIGLASSASVFAVQSSVSIGDLPEYSGDGGAASIITYLNNSLQTWSNQNVTPQVNANANAISTNTMDISGIQTTISNLPTTLDVTTDISNAITTAIGDSGSITSAISNAISTPGNPVNTAISTVIGNAITASTTATSSGSIGAAIAASVISPITITTAGSTINTAINTAIGNAISSSTINPVNTAIGSAITSNTTVNGLNTAINGNGGSIPGVVNNISTINNTLNGSTNNGVTSYGLAQHLGSGFWFANTNATLQTALINAGAEAAKNGNPQTVQLSGGSYTLSSPLTIPTHVTLEGAGEEVTYIMIYHQPKGTLITMDPDSALSNLSLQNESANANATLYLNTNNPGDNNFSISHVHLTGNVAFSLPAAGWNNAQPFSLGIKFSYLSIGSLMSNNDFETTNSTDVFWIYDNRFDMKNNQPGCNVFTSFDDADWGSGIPGLIMPANQGQTGQGANEAWQYCANPQPQPQPQ